MSSIERRMAEYYAKEVASGDESARIHLRLSVLTWKRNQFDEFTTVMASLQARAGVTA
jgi:hypothetical protein